MSRLIQLLTCGLCSLLTIAAIGCTSEQPAAAQPQPPASAEQADEANKPVEAKAEPAGEAEPSPYIDLALPSRADRAAQEKIRQALQKKVTVDFKEVPLEKAAAELAKQGGFEIRIDETALQEEGLLTDEPITLSLPVSIRLRSAMDTMLDPLFLTWVQRGNEVIVTTAITAEEILSNRYYSSRKLMDLGLTSESLEQFIQDETSGPWMEVDGTGGHIAILPGVLAVRQTEGVHQEIADALKTLERVASSAEKSGFAPLYGENSAVYNALNRKLTFSLENVPLSRLPAELSEVVGVNVILSHESLEEEQINPDTAVSIQVQDVLLRTALVNLLEPLDLTVVPAQGVLAITTEIDAEEKLDTFIYNIRDFAEAGYDAYVLSELIEWGTSGPWMYIDRTGGTVMPLEPDFLVVRQTVKNHLEVPAVLDEFRRFLSQTSPDGKLPRIVESNDLIVKHYNQMDIPALAELPTDVLVETIPKFVAPKSWKANGGEGDISIVKSVLVVRQTARVHRQVRRFVEALRWKSVLPFLFGDPKSPAGSTGTPAP